MLNKDDLLKLVKPREPFTLYDDDCGSIYVSDWRHLYVPGFGEMGVYEGTDEGFVDYLLDGGWVYNNREDAEQAFFRNNQQFWGGA